MPPRTFGLWLHPHAPAAVDEHPPSRVHWAYSRGADPADFRRVQTVTIDDAGRLRGPRLHKHGLVGDPQRQFYGWGGPFLFYADFSRTCVDCAEAFVFTAKAQQFWFEELGAWCDASAIRCLPCRRARRAERDTQVAWQAAQAGWASDGPRAAAAVALAQAGLDLVEAGGGTDRVLQEAIGALRQAIRQAPDEALPVGWLAHLQLARGRLEAARPLADEFLQRTAHRKDPTTRALRKAVARTLHRMEAVNRIP